MINKFYKQNISIIILALFPLIFSNTLQSYTKVFLDTDIKTSYIDYSNLDFELNSSSKNIDNYNFIYSYLNIALKTEIQGVDNLEVCTKLSSLGKWGSGNSYYVLSSSLSVIEPYYWWEKSLPYPYTDFTPFISELYTKYTYTFTNPVNKLRQYVEEIPLTVKLGRQEIEIVDGVVVGKNGMGLDALNISFTLDKYFYFETFMSRAVAEIITTRTPLSENRNYIIYGSVYGTKYSDDYDFGISNIVEENNFLQDKKIFTEYFIKHTKENLYYVFEYAQQNGQKGKDIIYSGSVYYFKAGLSGGGSRLLGKSNVDIIWILTSGCDEGKVFAPTFGKLYDGLEPTGFGDFAAGSTQNLFFGMPEGYSGMFILGMKLKVNPLKNFFPGFNYFLYSSPEAYADKPDASYTEQMLGAKKAIGIEYGLTAEYVVSNYIKLNLEYIVFDPTANVYNSKGNPAYKLKLASQVKF